MDQEGRKANRLDSLVMEAEREYKEAKEVAEALHLALPTREVLIDSENYWDTEVESWRVWREGAERK